MRPNHMSMQMSSLDSPLCCKRCCLADKGTVNPARRRWPALVMRVAIAIAVTASALPVPAGDRVHKGEMAGYLLVPNERVPDAYDAGFSVYVAA